MKKDKTEEAVSTLLGRETRLEGSIRFRHTIKIEGEVKGEISSDSGTLIIGENAVIKGDITVDQALIWGQVNGNVSARKMIEIYSSAKVTGDIRTPLITIQPGSFYTGICNMDSSQK